MRPSAAIPDDNAPLRLADPSPDPSITDAEWAGFRKIANMMNRAGRRMKGPRVSAAPAESVYVIRCGDFIKIGMTLDLPQRVKDFQTGNPHQIEIIAVIDAAGRATETRLHRHFAKFRHRYEWFHLKGELADWVYRGCPAELPDLSP